MPYVPLDWSSAFGGFCSTLLLGLFGFGTCRIARPLALGFWRFPLAILLSHLVWHGPGAFPDLFGFLKSIVPFSLDRWLTG